MADSASASVSGSEETQGQRQARLRREKRTAKIQSEGSDRLSKITQLNGRIAPPAELRKHSTTMCYIRGSMTNSGQSLQDQKQRPQSTKTTPMKSTSPNTTGHPHHARMPYNHSRTLLQACQAWVLRPMVPQKQTQ